MSNRPESPAPRGEWAAALFALLFPALGTWVYFIALRAAPTALQQITFAAEKVLQFGFPVAWVLVVCRERLKRPPRPWRGVGPGLGFGLAVMGGILALYHLWLLPAGHLDAALGPVQDKIAGFGVAGPVKYAVFAGFVCLVHSFLEEYYWRWFVFGRLSRLMPAGPAIAVSSLGFMAHHVLVLGLYFGWLAPATWGFSLCVALGGAFWAWLYHRSGSLLGPWLSHVLVDVAIFLVGYHMAGELLAR